MKALFILVLLSGTVQADEYVQGYMRRDGTYVNGYIRSDRDGNPYNNYSNTRETYQQPTYDSGSQYNNYGNTQGYNSKRRY